MTKAPINYKNGKIYKIEPICEHDEGDIYIGSTTKQYLSQRMTKHIYTYKGYKEGKSSKVLSYDLFDKYGLENCKIILLELVEANSKDELHQREAYFIKTLKCINKYIPLRTNKEYRKDNKNKLDEKNKKYYEDNKDILNEKNKKYYEDNKNNILEKRKIYNQLHTDKIKEYKKNYYINHKN